MPPSPGSSPRAGRTSSDDRARRVRFRRAVTLLLMTLVFPGSAQLVAGNRAVGRAACRLSVALVLVAVGGGLTAMVWPGAVLWAAADTTLLWWLRWGLIGLALGWAYLMVDAWRLGQPLTLAQGQRLTVVGLNGLLCFSVAGGLLFGAHLVAVQRDFLRTTFSDGPAVAAHQGRYNVLLLGGDSGAGRWGLRPDSITVASIDAETGKTVLIGLPRNLADFPFRPGSVLDRQFPDGFDCDGCYLNGLSTWADDHADLFKGSANPGVDATVMGVEGITGLRINYWVMVNLQGFRELVDAVGGVTLRVRQPIPVGGLGEDVTGYIEPGVRRLNGHDTLWFARAREGSDDYSRMARQKCVLNAMLHQVSPRTAVANFADIAAAGSAMIATDLPTSEVDRFASLALKARTQPIATVSLVPPQIDTAHPDIPLVRRLITDAIDRSEGRFNLARLYSRTLAAAAPAAPREHAPAADPVTGGSRGSRNDGYVANQSDDLGAAC